MRIVVKITGKFIEKENLSIISEKIRYERGNGNEIIIVHGGGKEINEEFELRGTKPKFIEGLRITGKEEISLIEMVLSGKVNKRIVSIFLSNKIPAVGISGKDGGMIIAKRKSEELGYVGEVVKVNPKLIDILLKEGFIPVVSPIGYGVDGETLNINGDTFASHLSVGIRAKKLIFITDVKGVMDKDGELINFIEEGDVEKLIESEVITHGMIPKVRGGIYAVKNGVDEVIIGTIGDEKSFNIKGTIIRRER